MTASAQHQPVARAASSLSATSCRSRTGEILTDSVAAYARRAACSRFPHEGACIEGRDRLRLYCPEPDRSTDWKLRNGSLAAG